MKNSKALLCLVIICPLILVGCASTSKDSGTSDNSKKNNTSNNPYYPLTGHWTATRRI